jgi:hypothetical protein
MVLLMKSLTGNLALIKFLQDGSDIASQNAAISSTSDLDTFLGFTCTNSGVL